MFSFTLQVKSDGYRRNRNTRVFLCAASQDESGQEALDWVMESFVQDGDELIVFRGFDADELGKLGLFVYWLLRDNGMYAMPLARPRLSSRVVFLSKFTLN